MGHYGWFPNGNQCDVQTRCKLGHMSTSRILSKKFMSTQHNYCMHKHETLVVLEALMKWEDKLLGRKFTVVTNHKGLEYFKTQPNLSPRQTRWWEYLSRFNYNTIYVDGT